MKGKRTISGVGAAALVAGSLLAVSPAFAQTPAPTAAVTAEQARDAALKAVPGTVLELELEREGGVLAYEVEIRADDGRVHEVMVDPNTGAVLGRALDGPDGPGDDDDRPAVSRSSRLASQRAAWQRSSPEPESGYSSWLTAI